MNVNLGYAIKTPSAPIYPDLTAASVNPASMEMEIIPRSVWT
jgi:hypothetical protein